MTNFNNDLTHLMDQPTYVYYILYKNKIKNKK